MESLQVSENLKEPCTGEWGSWHRIAYSPLKMAYSTIVRENLGGSVRETGMKQLPLVWVATGERGIVHMGNMEHDWDKTGAFIAQKAGLNIHEIPITTDREGRRSVIVTHPSKEQATLRYFHDAIKLMNGYIQTGQTKVYHPQQVMMK